MSRLTRVLRVTALLLPLVAVLTASAEIPCDVDCGVQFGTYHDDCFWDVSVSATGSYVAGFTGIPSYPQRPGYYDVILRKYDTDCGLIWGRQFTSSGEFREEANGVFSCIEEGLGEVVYVAGYTEGALGGANAGGFDAFIRKYDADGNVLWTTQFGTPSNDWPSDVWADEGGVYIVGYTEGALEASNAGGRDAFVRKYDLDGTTILWTRQFGGSGNDEANGISVDVSGVYVVATLRFPYDSGANDVFVRKYDVYGTEVWVRQIGTGDYDNEYGQGISVDGVAVYVSGTTYGVFQGQTKAGTGYHCDAFVRKYDIYGNEEWTRQFGGYKGLDGAYDWANKVFAHGTGVHVVGYTDGDLPGWSGAGRFDCFFREYDIDGNEEWTCQFGTAADDFTGGISAHRSDVCVAGKTSGALFPPTHYGSRDGFLSRWTLNSPPTVDAGGPYSANEGGSVTVTAVGSDPDPGDVLTYAWDLDNDGTFETPGQSVPFSAAGLDGPSTQTIAVKVTDAGGLSATDEATVDVHNVAPLVGEITAPIDPLAVPAEVVASADFVDPGTGETYSAEWDWGDNTSSSGNVSGNHVTGNHPYTEAGVYTVTLVVSDRVASGTSVFHYVVVYDPTEGFVTGGGWIMSPPGAYLHAPDFTGKANFGFVSKYKKGATVPTGNTQFSFELPDADFDFHSTEYQWLVIAGAKAMFKGYGTINDQGEYGFKLTGVDGALRGEGFDDLFRIKIWDNASQEIVYDNLLGLAEEMDPQPIGGGNIVIHTGGNGPQSSWNATRFPVVFALEQNQPNPFHGSTRMQYSLPADRNVSLRIYDSAGRLVRTLVDEHQASGFYGIEWDGIDASGVRAATGIYLVRLVAGDFTSAKKMILMR